jgi:hypothetical protein
MAKIVPTSGPITLGNTTVSLLVVLPYGCDFAFMYCQGLLYSFVTCNQTYYY